MTSVTFQKLKLVCQGQVLNIFQTPFRGHTSQCSDVPWTSLLDSLLKSNLLAFPSCIAMSHFTISQFKFLSQLQQLGFFGN